MSNLYKYGKKYFILALSILLILSATSIGFAVYFYGKSDCSVSENDVRELRIKRDSLLVQVNNRSNRLSNVLIQFDSLIVRYDSIKNKNDRNRLKLAQLRKKLDNHERIFDSLSNSSVDSVFSEYFKRTGHTKVFYVIPKSAIDF